MGINLPAYRILGRVNKFKRLTNTYTELKSLQKFK